MMVNFAILVTAGDHARQDSMDFSSEWGDPANCRCGDRLKPLERRAARQHQRCLAHSLVGTPNYIAPEVLLRTGNGCIFVLQSHCKVTGIQVSCFTFPTPLLFPRMWYFNKKINSC